MPEWLTSPEAWGAVGGWIAAAAAVAALLLQRQRPQQIDCRVLQRNELLVGTPWRENLRVHYGSRVLEQPSEVRFELVNKGVEPIRNAIIRVSLAEGSMVVLSHATHAGGVERKVDVKEWGDVIQIELEYLNSEKKHRDRVEVAALCDGSARLEHVDGSGPGWSARLVDPVAKSRSVRRRGLLAASAGAIMMAALFYGWGVAPVYTIPWALVVVAAVLVISLFAGGDVPTNILAPNDGNSVSPSL